jgi:hypothetical protein
MLRGLEIGVNDYLLRLVDKNELLARAAPRSASGAIPTICATTCRTRSMAITDALTGRHNRRYMEAIWRPRPAAISSRGKPLALMISTSTSSRRSTTITATTPATTYASSPSVIRCRSCGIDLAPLRRRNSSS